MKFLVSVFLLSLLQSPQALAQFHRFYRGYVLAGTEMTAYLDTMNKDFFPLFPQAAPHGLISYKPVLLNEAKHLNLPQEIALLTFKDEETYKVYGTTEIGKKIRAAHGPVFDATKSVSLVPVPFAGTAKPEVAYAMNPEFKDFTTGAAGVLIQGEPFATPEATLKDVERTLKETGKKNMLSLVAESYVMEYLFAKDADALEEMRKARCSQFKGTFKFNKFVPLTKHKVGAKRVGFGEGMDAEL
jgi:hypothetical protein